MKTIFKQLFLISFVLVYISSFVQSQTLPENGILFKDDEVCIVKIDMHPDSLLELLAPGNEDSDHEYPARFIYINSLVNDTIENIGFRLRGNTSRDSQKKSFKVSFNTFFGGRKYQGVEKVNLNGEHNDPSIIRSKLSFDLFKNTGVAASRSNHVELYINNEYKGLYINVEHIDEEFVESRFGNKNGNLYKCLWPAPLEYIDNNPDSYKYTNDGRRAYELKTNEELDNYADLANFINVLNNTPIESLHTELEPVFNVNSYLNYLAVEILTGHWDAYSFNQNNYYLYHNQQTEKFEFIPYDLDNTFGIYWSDIDWAVRNIYNWSNGTDRPLTYRLLQNDVYKDRFTFFITKLLNNYFDPTEIFPKIDVIKTMITNSAENDLYRTLDYNWNIQDFHNSYNFSLGDHVKYGLKPYITSRFNAANSQILTNSISPIISRVGFNKLFINRDLGVFAQVEDDDGSPSVNIHYQINSSTFVNVEMVDDGTGNDSIAGDNIYSVLISSPLSSPGIVEFYISATDINLNSSYEPANNMYSIIIPEDSDIELYINEFMASNSNIIADEYGEFDDWVEIYNAGTESVWLGDKYLSDDSFNPSKWQMPDVELHPNEFYLFWADGNTIQGENHTSFKLSASGEEIGIYDSQENNFAEIDYIAFGLQLSNVSLGRIPDGTGEVSFLPFSTPGFSNTSTVAVNELKKNSFSVFPNPVADVLNIQFTESLKCLNIVKFYDITGKIVSQKYILSGNSLVQLNLSDMNMKSGMYIVSVFSEDGRLYTTDNKIIFKN